MGFSGARMDSEEPLGRSELDPNYLSASGLSLSSLRVQGGPRAGMGASGRDWRGQLAAGLGGEMVSLFVWTGEWTVGCGMWAVEAGSGDERASEYVPWLGGVLIDQAAIGRGGRRGEYKGRRS